MTRGALAEFATVISIIIPAHNEANVIRRGLELLAGGFAAGEAEVIVVCNGCRDHTADVARSVGGIVRVIETDIPSKVNALNLGDDAARGFPRFYVDADVRLDAATARRLAESVARDGWLAVSPTPRMDFSRANWLVRSYYRMWSALPYTKGGFMGAGVYVLSETGRGRFDRFPDIIADDGYVRLLFAGNERASVAGCQAEVTAPATLRELIKIKTRSRLGRLQLKQRYPGLFAREAQDKHYGGAVGLIARQPQLWPCVPAYAAVVLATRYRAGKQLKRAATHVWERDESSRAAATMATTTTTAAVGGQSKTLAVPQGRGAAAAAVVAVAGGRGL
jgi:hypothetical protein